jgi:hypothetical protein
MSGLYRYGKIVAAAALLAVLAGCVVVPAPGFYGHPHYWGGYYYR